MVAKYLKAGKTLHIFECGTTKTIKVDGKLKEVTSTKSIRIYTNFKAKEIEVEMSDLTPFVDSEGNVSSNFFFL